MCDVEEYMRASLEGQFFPYVGKPVYLTPSQNKEQLERAEKLRIKQEEEARKRQEAELMSQRVMSEPDYRRIIAVVAHVHRVTLDDLMGKSRKYPVALARHHAAWELRNRKSQFSLNKIGQLLNRDHSTVINSLEFMSKSGHALKDKLDAVAQLITKQGLTT